MVRALEATYENGVFVPATAPGLREHARVRLVIEPIEGVGGAPEGSSGAADRAGGRTDGGSGGWQRLRELGQRLAATSVPGAPSLTEAVSQMRR